MCRIIVEVIVETADTNKSLKEFLMKLIKVLVQPELSTCKGNNLGVQVVLLWKIDRGLATF